MKKGLGCLSTLIILVCVAVCVVLAVKMFRGNDTKATVSDTSSPLASPLPDNTDALPGLSIETQTDSGAMTVTVGQDKLRELIQNSLDEKFPLTLASLAIHDKGGLDVTGSLERDVFLEFAEEPDSGVGAIEKMLIKLAPELLEFNVSFEASYHASTGELRLEPQKFIIEELEIPVSIIPSALTDKFSVAVESYAADLGYSVKSVAFYEGYIVLSIE